MASNTFKNLTSKIKHTSVGEKVTGKLNNLLHHHDTSSHSLSMHFKDTEEDAPELTSFNESCKSPEKTTRKTVPENPATSSGNSPDSKLSQRHSFEFVEPAAMASSEMYEQQLTQLQEQLVSVMIENGNLKTSLQDIQRNSRLSTLERDLQYERGKNRELVEKITKMTNPKTHRKGSPSPSYSGQWSTREIELEQETMVDNRENIPALDSSDVTDATHPPGWISRMFDVIIYQFYVMVDDFSVTSDDFQHIEPEETLAVKKLKDNVQRFGKGLKPIFSTMSGLNLLFNWHSPLLTGSIFMLWMYSCLTGYLIPNIIFLIILRLFLNLLEEWKVIRVMQLLPKKAVSDDPDSEQDASSVSGKFNIVIQVATKVQNKLGLIADGLEKLSNLLTWKVPEHTKQIFVPLCISLLVSFYLSVDTLVMMTGLGMGLKLFIIDALYNRFPRVKAKYDTTARLWLQLMTNAQLEKQRLYDANNQMVLSSHTHQTNKISRNRRTVSSESIETFSISEDDKEFCEKFNLPYEERPVKDSAFKNGKHCVYFEKDAQFSISTALNNHCKLWLTPSFLCYEKKSYLEAIPLANITRIDKKKPISFLPGSGMALEISVTGFEKPHIFGGLIGRDECYETLLRIGEENDLDYYKHHVENRPHLKPQMRFSEIGADELDDTTIAQ